MKTDDLLKIGFWGLVIYALTRQPNQPSNNISYDNPRQIPQFSHNSSTNPEIRSIVKEVSDRAFEEPNRANLTSTQRTSNFAPLTLDSVLEHLAHFELKVPSLLEPQITKPSPNPHTIEAGNWLRLIRHPSIVIILGKRGSGKSALGYRLLEHLRWTANLYVVGLPKQARKYLPDWIGVATRLEEVPPGSIVLVDEGYLHYHARRSMAAASVEMSQILNLSRQRNQTLIFVTQEAGQIDRNVASSANVVIFKELGMLQLEFDRRELNKIAANAQQAFATVSGDKRTLAYVYSPDSDFKGLEQNSLPTF